MDLYFPTFCKCNELLLRNPFIKIMDLYFPTFWTCNELLSHLISTGLKYTFIKSNRLGLPFFLKTNGYTIKSIRHYSLQLNTRISLHITISSWKYDRVLKVCHECSIQNPENIFNSKGMKYCHQKKNVHFHHQHQIKSSSHSIKNIKLN